MKKMQCEVCGSTTIKKIDDSTFECQSCGVQYSKDEVQKLLVEITGEVKIDHSQDAENMVKRAKQFEDRGDQEKAQEYYEKALDFDPDNEEATNATSQKSQLASDIVILEPDISSEKAEENLFHYLYNRSKLAPDFFADVEIIDKTEKYYPFTVAHGNISGTFTGTSCYKHEVPYTDYENKQVRLSNGTYRTERVPVTKYRTEIEKRPASGQFSTTAAGVYSISPDLNGRITTVKAADIDGLDTNNNATGNEVLCGAKMFVDFESLSFEIARKHSNGFAAFDKGEITSQDNKQFYKNFEIDLNLDDKSWLDRATQKYAHEVDFACRMSARSACPGDYCEDVSYVQTSNNSTTLTYYIPVQIIEYAYKGDFYVAIQILHTSCNKIAATYPINKDAVILQAQSENANIEANKTSAPGVVAWIFGAIGVLLLIIFVNTEIESWGMVFFIIASFLIALVGGILESQNTKKKKALLNEINEKMVEERRSVEGILEETFRIFIEDFSQTKSVKEASAKARSSVSSLLDSSKHSINFSEFATPKIVSTNSLKKAVSKEPGKVFVYIGKRNTIGGAVRITIDGEEQGIIRSNEHIAIDIEKDCTIDCKWNQAFTKVSVKAFAGQTKVIYLEYGGSNLIVNEVDGDDRFDDFLRSGDMQTAIDCYCAEYEVEDDVAIIALEKRKMEL